MNMKTLITLKSGVEIRCFEDAENIYADLHGTMMFASVAAEEARIAVLIGDESEESFGCLFGDSGQAMQYKLACRNGEISFDEELPF